MSRGRAIVAFALVASLLVVAATPAAAAHGPFVVSTHSTDADFNDATLTNMTVVGSGESATVQLESAVADQDDGGVSYYDFNDGTATDQWGSNDGSVTGATHLPSGGPRGDGAYSFDGTNDHIRVSDSADLSGLDSHTAMAWVYLDSTSTTDDHISKWDMSTSSDLEWLLTTISGKPRALVHAGGSTQFVDAVTTISAGRWVHIAQVYDGSTLEIYINGSLDNSKSVTGAISDTGTDVLIGGREDGAGVDSSELMDGDIDEPRIYDTDLTGTQISKVYEATKPGGTGLLQTPAEYLNNHSATNTVQGFANISTADNVTVTATWRGDSNGDGSYDTLLNQTTGITTTGNHTFTWTEFAGDDVRLNLTVKSTGTDEQFVLESEGVLANTESPTVDNGSASPTGALQTATPTLSIDINDSDFGTGHGDDVDVKFYVDGVLQGTDTLTSNGTAQLSISSLDGGDHTWHVQAVDSFGHTQTSQTFTISTPGNLTIRRELAPDELVTDAQVNITGYYSGEVIHRSDTDLDGNISLSGFPLDEPIIVRATADGYYTRTAVIVDVFEQNSVYLLNSSEATYRVRFDLQDPTGQYDRSDTVLFIDRDLNVSGSVEWRVIAGDNFGIEGVPVDLAQEERYRLRIKNLETGDTATLGSFTAIQDETVTLSPGAATLVFEDIEREFTWEARENETSQKIIVEYAEESSSNTADVKITIHERFNESNILVNNQSYSSVNSLVFEQSLADDEVNKTWSLVLYIDRGDGFVRYGPEPIGGGPRELIPVELDAVWRTAIGVFVLLISSMAFSELNTGVGVVATALIGGLLWFIGLLALVATGPAVVFAIAIALAYQYRSGAGV